MSDLLGGSRHVGLNVGIALQVGGWNSGDTLPTYSGRQLLQAAAHPLSLDSWFLHEPAPLDLTRFEMVPYDLAAVICTPWLWDQAASSRKYDILRGFTARMSVPRKVAIGVGSSFLLHNLDVGEAAPGQNAARLCASDWADFSMIVCRDRLAAHLFSGIVPEDRVVTLPCPSFYSARIFGIEHMPIHPDLLVYADISPENYWGTLDSDLRLAIETQDKLVRDGVHVMTMLERDRIGFANRFGRQPDADVRSPREILRYIAQFRTLTSVRVHACMPALSLGLDVSIIPLDSRALTATGAGATPIAVSLKEVEPFSRALPPTSMETYIDILRDGLA